MSNYLTKVYQELHKPEDMTPKPCGECGAKNSVVKRFCGTAMDFVEVCTACGDH